MITGVLERRYFNRVKRTHANPNEKKTSFNLIYYKLHS